MIRSTSRPWLGGTDLGLWIAVALIVPLGLLMVNSAALAVSETRHLSNEAVRQAVYAATGVILMFATSRVDYRLLQRFAVPTYAVTMTLLVAVLVVGVSEHGARRWLGVTGFTVQPAELAKLALAVALAAYCSARNVRAGTIAATLGVTAIPIGLILLQPDLGTVIVLGGVWLVFLVGWGISWRTLAFMIIAVAAAGPFAFAIAVPEYQRERLAVFLDPSRDPLGSGFNLRQVEIALGTGGLTGHGLFSGAQSHLDSVAARSSDFMFGFLGAELGLLGGILLMLVLGLAIVRGLTVAERTNDSFGRLLALALTAIILVQGTLNIAVNLRLFPVTGIPLPFVSQGGSSLVVMLVAVGLIQAIASRRAVAT